MFKYSLMKDLFEGNIVLVTGATGLIAQSLVKKLLDNGAIVLAQVRNVRSGLSAFLLCAHMKHCDPCE